MLIQNARVLRSRGFTPPNWCVRVTDGEVREIGPGIDQVPQGSSMDLGGRWLLPGLINSHAHILMDESDRSTPRHHYPRGHAIGILEAARRGKRALRSGITTIRDCNGIPSDVLALQTAFEEGMLPGPRIFASGQAICAPGGHMHSISVEAEGPDEVQRAVRKQVNAGVDFIKLIAEGGSTGGAIEHPRLQLTVAEMSAGIDEAHRLQKRVTVHAVSRVGVEAAVSAGADSIEHGYEISEPTLELMADRGVWLVPTLSVQNAIATSGMAIGFSLEITDRARRYLDLALTTVALAREYGVRISCGSDAGSPSNPLADLVTEIRLLVNAGLRPLEAIHSATTESAALLGVEDRIGAIDVGMVADMLVLDADPVADVQSIAGVRTVFKEGQVQVNKA